MQNKASFSNDATVFPVRPVKARTSVNLKIFVSEFLASPMHLHLNLYHEDDWTENGVFIINLSPNQNVQDSRFSSLDQPNVNAIGCLQWMKIFNSEEAKCPDIKRRGFKSLLILVARTLVQI